jgi:hypothetical protein
MCKRLNRIISAEIIMLFGVSCDDNISVKVKEIYKWRIYNTDYAV